jgi:hypothetical protein
VVVVKLTAGLYLECLSSTKRNKDNAVGTTVEICTGHLPNAGHVIALLYCFPVLIIVVQIQLVGLRGAFSIEEITN